MPTTVTNEVYLDVSDDKPSVKESLESFVLKKLAAKRGKDAVPANKTGAGVYQTSPAGPTAFDKKFEEVEKQHGLRSGLLRDIARAESAFNPEAGSHTGVRGLMQITRKTGAAYGLGSQEHMNPDRQIETAGAYMKDLMDEFEGNEPFAVLAYNAGPGVVRHYIDTGEIRGTAAKVEEIKNYIPRVLGKALPPNTDYKTSASVASVEEAPASQKVPNKLGAGIYEDPNTGGLFSIDESGEMEVYDSASNMWLATSSERLQKEDEAVKKRRGILNPLYTGPENVKPWPIPSQGVPEMPNPNLNTDVPFLSGAGKV